MAGEIVHIEFPSEDADRGAAFWHGLFGWSFQDSGMPDMDYRMGQAGGGAGAAVFPSENRSGHPNFYFATDDIEASLAKVRELGGQAGERAPVPGHGWFASCSDSEGNAFHLWQADQSAAG
jgi:predicted enzyme related to lactoylglutathione lyase